MFAASAAAFLARFPALAQWRRLSSSPHLVGLFSFLFGQPRARRLGVASGISTRFTPRVERLESRQLLSAVYVMPQSSWTDTTVSGRFAAGDTVQATLAPFGIAHHGDVGGGDGCR